LVLWYNDLVTAVEAGQPVRAGVKVARGSIRITGSGCVNRPVGIRSNDLQNPHEAPCVSEG